jgi:hypothetical protein
MKVKHELGFVYITSDGKRFLSYKDAIKHEEKYQKDLQDIETLQEVFKNFKQ